MGNKGVLSVLSCVVLIAAVFSVVATVVNCNSIDAAALCSHTLYSDVCMKTLGPILNGSVDPKEAIRAAFQSTSAQIVAAIELSKNVSQGTSDEFNKNAFNDCHQLLQDVSEELRAAMTVSHDVAERIHDIGIWLSAIITYQETCIDGITQPEE